MAFLAEHQVRVVASLPCYSEGTVNAQRGGGVFARSIRGLQARCWAGASGLWGAAAVRCPRHLGAGSLRCATPPQPHTARPLSPPLPPRTLHF